jgi:hypothetical protein
VKFLVRCAGPKTSFGDSPLIYLLTPEIVTCDIARNTAVFLAPSS